jgi:hypothetical protein
VSRRHLGRDRRSTTQIVAASTVSVQHTGLTSRHISMRAVVIAGGDHHATQGEIKDEREPRNIHAEVCPPLPRERCRRRCPGRHCDGDLSRARRLTRHLMGGSITPPADSAHSQETPAPRSG